MLLGIRSDSMNSEDTESDFDNDIKSDNSDQGDNDIEN